MRPGKPGKLIKIALAPVVAIAIIIIAFAAYNYMRERAASLAPPPPLNITTESQAYNPSIWGESYPDEYQTWLLTKNNKSTKRSVYKRGSTDGTAYDKLSEYPYLALLYAGWGFGVEYNEPRGHYNMLEDQTAIDESRLKAGGVCLTCKTPYSVKLFADHGPALYSMPYEEAVGLIAKRDGQIGTTCIDCHNPENMQLRPLRTAGREMLASVGKTDIVSGDMRSLVCSQCHSSYIITRDAAMKPTALELPWQNGGWGNLTVDGMIAQIESDPANLEWTQSVTGLQLGFIRHPEFEMYSRNSSHWAKSVACSSCHMETLTKDSKEPYFSHNTTSPLETNMRQCVICHNKSTAAKLRARVIAGQKRYVREMNTAGYATAAAALLIERANGVKAGGGAIDDARFNAAKTAYRQAFYRVVFLAAENSVGFHNPKEAARVARDAALYASESQGTLIALLTEAGAPPPAVINLDLPKYLNNRGEDDLMFNANLEYESDGAFPDIPLMAYIKGI